MNPLSGVLGEAWQMYRRFAGHLLAIAFIIYVAAAIVAGLLSLAGVAGSLLASIVELFAAFLLQATLVKAVQDIRDGRADMSIGETMSSALPYIWSVAGASILAGIAITIGLILIIVPGLWLITIWAVIIPVIIIERSGALNSFGRSRQLVRGHGWHVFGTLVLVFIILIVVDIVLGIIFVALPLVWRNGLSTVISGTLVAPFLALVVTLIYYRLVGSGGGWPSAAAGAAPGGYGTPPGYGPQGGYGTPQDPAAGPGGYGTPPPPPPPGGPAGYPPGGPGGYGPPPSAPPGDPGGYGTPPPPPPPPPSPGGYQAPGGQSGGYEPPGGYSGTR